MKISFAIYADTTSLLDKILSRDNKSYQYTACAYSLFSHCSFDNKKATGSLQR